MAEAVSDKKDEKLIAIPVDEYESMKATLEILSDPKMLAEVLKGEADAKAGRTRKLSEVAKELGI